MNFVYKAQKKLNIFVENLKGYQVKLVSLKPYLNLGIDAKFVDENNCERVWRFHDDFAIEFLPYEKYDRAYHYEWQQFMINYVLDKQEIMDYDAKVKPYKSKNEKEITTSVSTGQTL